MAADIEHLPLPENYTAQELLANCSTRPFDDVMIIGFTEDGEMRYASTMSKANVLHAMEFYKLIHLGVIEGMSRKD